jgi:glutathione-regulated potassium-efflux system ancillary protein KefC
MTEHMPNWLSLGLVYLAAAVIAVPLARFFGLGSIIGYLGAGIAIGPFGLKLVSDPQAMLHFAEFGVVLMLFLVGLELEPRRLWAMRRPIFGWGSVQLIGSTLLMFGVGVLAGAPWRLALVAALGLAMSSTAIGLTVMTERNLGNTSAGQGVLSVMLLQDIAAIPVLALVPLLAIGAAHDDGGPPFWIEALRALGVIVAIVLVGRLLLRPALRWIARSETPEIFTAAALLLVVATAALMQSVGLSMALGAFLAGVLLAESEYRRELETDLEPFKGLLLGLFFIAVGMGIDFNVVLQRPGLIVALVLGFVLLKALLLWAMARTMPVPLAERPEFIILLAQGGEFGFVIFQAATQGRVIGADVASLLVAVVTVSMLLTPLLLLAVDRWWAAHLRAQRIEPAEHRLDAPQDAPVILAGFGRYGQILARLLFSVGVRVTVLDHDAEQVETARRFGWRVYYGDATRLDLLRTAGAAGAQVLVVAIDDMEQNLALVDLAREHFPQLQIVARARDARHWTQLYRRGVRLIERETLDAALMSGRSVLELLGAEPHRARMLAMRFRRHSIEQLEAMAPHLGDQARLISISKAGRQQLEQLLAQERELAQRTRCRGGDAPADRASG